VSVEVAVSGPELVLETPSTVSTTRFLIFATGKKKIVSNALEMSKKVGERLNKID